MGTAATASSGRHSSAIHHILRRPWLYVMLVPGVLYYVVFKYLPMWGVLIAFQDFSPYLGLRQSAWVGLKHFQRLFHHWDFWLMLRNTVVFSMYGLLVSFWIPVILSLLINEVRSPFYKRAVQTLIYIPHFISWVVVMSLTYIFLTNDGGLLTELLVSWGLPRYNFMMNPRIFRPLIVAQGIWKSAGWGTIIYLAALSGVQEELYESAVLDGATRWRMAWSITLPSIKGTIATLLILRIGDFLDVSYEQIYLMLTPLTREVGEVFDTYIYTMGVSGGQFSYTTAIGLFKALVGLVLVVGANSLAKRVGEEGIY